MIGYYLLDRIFARVFFLICMKKFVYKMPENYSCFVCINFAGWLSGKIKEGFDSDGAIVVQSALQDPSIICS